MKLLVKLILSSAVCLLLFSCTTETINKNAPAKNQNEASSLNVQLGLRYLNQGNMSRAKQKLLLAIKQQESLRSYGAMAYFYEKTGDSKSADSFYLKAISENSAAGAGHNNYGAFLCRQGKYQQAEHQFQLAVGDSSYLNTASAYENAGLCALLIPNQAQAQSYFEKAVQQDPRMWSSLAQLAKINYQQGNFAKANQYLQSYLKTNDLSPDFLLLGVKVGQKLRNQRLAKQYSNLLKRQFPKSKQYQQSIKLVR